MSLVTPAAWTTPQIETITRLQILKRALRQTALGITGTTTGAGSTTTFVDTTMFGSAAVNVNEWYGAWVRFTSGTLAGQFFNIVPTITVGTGTVTFSPTAGGSPGSSATYEIWKQVNPQQVLDALDDIVVQELMFPCWTILSEVPDGDMEQNNTTDWTTAVSATQTKQTAEPTMSGKRYLRVVTSGTNGYARSQLLNVVPGRAYHLSCLARASAASTTTQAILFDETNSVALKTLQWANLTTGRMWATVTVPTTCKQVSIRLGCAESLVTGYFDEVCFYALDTVDFPAPWWVYERAQVQGIFRLVPRLNLNSTTWAPELAGEIDQRWDVRPDDTFGRGQLRIMARQGGTNDPLFIFGARNETAFASDSETKNIDGNLVNAALCVRLYEMILARSVGVDQTAALRNLARWEDVFTKERRSHLKKLRDVFQSSTPWVAVGGSDIMEMGAAVR